MKGPLLSPMKGDLSLISQSSEMKAKRKCGRPRNPIPRHKRVSHINAEHRRRGKIQNGFQTLKNMVPKFETSGRDSKADILTKAVEYSRRLQEDCTEQEKLLQELRAQRLSLNKDIERHQTCLPEGQLFEELPPTADERLQDLIQSRACENWHFWVFGFFIQPLHTSYQMMINCSTTESFVTSVVEWAKHNMSTANLRSVALESLRNLSTKTSIMAHPELLPSEARQNCSVKVSPPVAVDNSLNPSLSTLYSHSPRQQHTPSPPVSKRMHSRKGRQRLQFSDSTQDPYSMLTPSDEDCFSIFDSPLSYKSSPSEVPHFKPDPLNLGANQYDSMSSSYGEHIAYDFSTRDHPYDTPPHDHLESPLYPNELSCSSFHEQNLSSQHHSQHIYSDVSALNMRQSPVSELTQTPYDSPGSPMTFDFSGSNEQQEMRRQQLSAMDGFPEIESSLLLEHAVNRQLLDDTDYHMLVDHAERNLLLENAECKELNISTEVSHHLYNMSGLDYDGTNLSPVFPCYTPL